MWSLYFCLNRMNDRINILWNQVLNRRISNLFFSTSNHNFIIAWPQVWSAVDWKHPNYIASLPKSFLSFTIFVSFYPSPQFQILARNFSTNYKVQEWGWGYELIWCLNLWMKSMNQLIRMLPSNDWEPGFIVVTFSKNEINLLDAIERW